MSGDVQPRKRKDKSKKRKEDDDPVPIREKRSSSEHSPDIQMHIEKESETGGHWCAKIVFFALLSILIGLVALIIIENRGMTEVAQPQGESRFSEYFEGWVEEPKDHDEEEHHVVGDLHDEDEGDDDHDDDHHDNTGAVYEEENLSQQEDDDDDVPPVSEETPVDDEPEQEVASTEEPDEEVANSQEEPVAADDDDNDEDEEDQNTSQQVPVSAENDDQNNNDDDEEDENVSAPPEINLDDGDLPFEEDATPDSTEQFFDNDAGEELYIKRMSEEKLAKSKEATRSVEADETPEKSSETFDNTFDLFEDDLNEANDNIEKNPKKALKLFEKVLKHQPKSKVALIGKANALNKLSDLYQDNNFLREAIQIYERLLFSEKEMMIDETMFEKIGVICVDRMIFLGNLYKAIEVQKVLVDRFPENVEHRNQLAIIYLMINRLSDAKNILHETLLKWRHNGVALVHYGFVLKQLDNDLEHAVIFLREGIESGENGTQEGLFYMNLGDALMRLGKPSEALEIYEEGARRGLFLSAYQRSLYNVNRLKGQAFWTVEETTYKKELDMIRIHWRQILKEGLTVMKDGFTDESENLRDIGDWKQYEIFARGRRNVANCKRTPFTCDLIEKFPSAASCKRGQVKYSVMLPATHVWPHTGPTNCRLRAHLGLKVPQGTFLRVANETKSWQEGEWLIFDDSFEHEVWHNGTERRLVLIVDVWHPEITEEERKSLTPI